MAPEIIGNGNGSGFNRKLTLKRILSYAISMGASDIHFKVPRPPVMRVDGSCRFAGEIHLTQEDMLGILDEIMTPAEKERFLLEGDADLALNMDGVGRFRVNVLKQRGTTAIIMRHVKSKIPDYRGLSLPEKAIQKIADHRRGMILVTGTTGSGKSTTLAAIIGIINHSRPEHIVTLEDPIEFVHEDAQCTIMQREIGVDTNDFKMALRALMREDPDVILIGEMRDIETFEAATHASETGHLVFSTVHTTNVMLTVDRIVDLYPPEQHNQVRTALSHQLRAILSQRLVVSADGVGRIPAVEIMFNTPAISSLIRENNLKQIPSAMVSGKGEYMQTFNMSLVALIERGLITEAGAMDASDNQDELKMNLQGIYVSTGGGGILKKRG